jgi:GNAT superfamily N-acetyltransferase
MVQSMVAEMQEYGGNAPATDQAAWDGISRAIAKEIETDEARYLIARTRTGQTIAVAGAKLIMLGGPFVPKQLLHLSAVFVNLPFRREGLATLLIKQLLDWGISVGATQCDLAVLSRSPAKHLYKILGFEPIEIKMVKSLLRQSDSRQTKPR